MSSGIDSRWAMGDIHEETEESPLLVQDEALQQNGDIINRRYAKATPVSQSAYVSEAPEDFDLESGGHR